MYYTFKDNKGNNLKVCIWNDNWHNTVTIENKNQDECIINEDRNGKYFIWKQEKFYLNDYHKITYDEIQNKINKKEWITSDEITQMILNEGKENIKLLIPLKYLDINEKDNKLITCNIIERDTDSYKIIKNYKIRVNYFIDNYEYSREFYSSDLTDIIRDKIIKIIK